MKSFLHFSAEFKSEHNPLAAKDIYLKAISNKDSCCIKSKGAEERQILFVANNDGVAWHNSFLPVVELNFYNAEFGAKIVANFRLRWSVRIMMYVYSLIMLVCELVFLHMYFQNKLASPIYLLVPMFFAMFVIIRSYVGLRLSSRPVKEFLEHIFKTDGPLS